MKRIIRYIYLPILLMVLVSTANAQRYSLYYTRTLYDGIQNPHHRTTDTCRSWATNFFVFPSMNLDFSVTGQANDFIKAFLASENLSKLSLENGGDNTFTNRLNYNIFMLKFRAGKKHGGEISLYSQFKMEAGFNMNNGIFNFITKGNYPYRGQTIDGFLDIGGGANAYLETGFGYRRQIYKNLSGGFKVGYLLGAANVDLNIKDTKFKTSSLGDTIDITVNGEIRTSVDPDNTGDIATNIMKNTGLAFSGGLQLDVTRKLTLSAAVLDLGGITWNDQSVTYKLGKTVRYTGIPALADSAVQDSVLKDFSEFTFDTLRGSYKSRLQTRVEFSAQYRWANWLHQTIIVSKPIYVDNLDLVFINNIRVFRRINFIALGSYNTGGFASIGGQFLWRNRGLDLYFGSEKILNTYQVTQQLADHTKKPALGLGADFNFGIAWGFGRCPRKRPQPVAALPSDSDGDGILDIIDDCPYTSGPSENKGCPWPDVDKDGTLDKDDACPMTPGPKENNGCPWPDADNDSIPDKDDKCPTAAGLKVNSGCPDTDNDGLFDDVDSCINTAGPIENKGCPWADTDGDGIFDIDDKCPNVAGPADNNGCPSIPQKVELTVEEQEVINKVFSNLNFEVGKSVIAVSSFESLNLLNELLLKKPSFKLLIEGHTDNAGKAVVNMKLSQTRADAVKKYFVDNGIDAARITAKGYGPTKPIADNKTAEGRARNRRVEFTILE